MDSTSTRLSKDLDEFQSRPKFKGIRHLVEDEADDPWMLLEEVLGGMKELARRDVAYDLFVRTAHLRHVVRLREHCPSLQLEVDHMPTPGIAEHGMESWAEEMKSSAYLPLMSGKLSELDRGADCKNWKPSDLQPFVSHVVNCFGYERLMLGTDWPVL